MLNPLTNVQLAEWIDDSTLIDLIQQSKYQVCCNPVENTVDLYIDASEDLLRRILQHSSGFLGLSDVIDRVRFAVDGIEQCGFSPQMMVEFEMLYAQYNSSSDLDTISQHYDIPENLNHPIALVDYLSGKPLVIHPSFASLYNTTVEAMTDRDIFLYWNDGLEALKAALYKYRKVRRLSCRVCLGADLVPTWVIVNALLLQRQSQLVCLIEIMIDEVHCESLHGEV